MFAYSSQHLSFCCWLCHKQCLSNVVSRFWASGRDPNAPLGPSPRHLGGPKCPRGSKTNKNGPWVINCGWFWTPTRTQIELMFNELLNRTIEKTEPIIHVLAAKLTTLDFVDFKFLQLWVVFCLGGTRLVSNQFINSVQKFWVTFSKLNLQDIPKLGWTPGWWSYGSYPRFKSPRKLH